MTHITCPTLSTEPGIKHGFFTREGGSSTGIYNSLNVGYGSGDDATTVTKNRAAIAAELGCKPSALCTPYQTHSVTVATINQPFAHEDAPRADALVTATPGIAIGILTADCLPVLFADTTHNVIAATHAGWKGAVGGILENTITAMQALGATLPNITASIGPAIAQGSYEVGEEFRDRFLAENPRNQIYFLHGAREKHFQFDLKAYAKDRLKNAGLQHINVLANDTCFEENRFFSYRRATLKGEPAYGRQVSALLLES